ncbi:MAG: hypothetical protein U5K43_15300 [Halofilum sp. (in: g-proteobacteria)]|nr:hypothetical protein [Halofilum sp. (in: g-proteobacteria)]
MPEVAEAMDIPLGTLKSRLHRARGGLRAAVLSGAHGTIRPDDS